MYIDTTNESPRSKAVYAILLAIAILTPTIIVNHTLSVVEEKVMQFDVWLEDNASVDAQPAYHDFYLQSPIEDERVLIESIYYSSSGSFDLVFCPSTPSASEVIKSIKASRFQGHFLEPRLASAVSRMSKIKLVEVDNLADAQSFCMP